MHASTRRFALRAAAKAALSASIVGCGGATEQPTQPATEESALATTKAAAAPSASSATTATSAALDAAAGAFDAALLALVTADAGLDATFAVADAETMTPREASTEACNGATDDRDADVSRATFDCCANELNALAGDADVGLDASAPSTKACCASVISYLDHQASPFGANYVRVQNVIGECCASFTPRSFEGACTPWGPAVPPSMPGSLLEVA